MSLYARIVMAVLIVLAVAAGFWKLDAAVNRILDAREQRGYDRAKTEDREAAAAQTARNLELQRAAEKRYTVAAEARERVIVETITEVRNAAQSLAACPVGPAVGVLNRAAACARGDSAACGPGEPLPVAR